MFVECDQYKRKKKDETNQGGKILQQKAKVLEQLYLGVMEEGRRRGGGGTLWGGALQKG